MEAAPVLEQEKDTVLKIRGSILDCIGSTPILRLGKLSRDLGGELLAKAEYMNPGGSLKDRVALAMVRQALDEGRVKPGGTIVEATAGNTGIGLALVTAAAGLRFLAVMTESDRGPKSQAMEAMGAEVVYAPDDAPWQSERGPLGMAARIARERGGLFVNQFDNPANPEVHERTTAPEILDAAGDLLDTVVLGVGSGGTLTGIGRALKPRLPRLRLVGVAGRGSYLGDGAHGDRIAGITSDFEPGTFDRSLADEVVCVGAEEAARAARRLAEVEGVPAGHSAGASLVVAERELRARPGSTVLILIGDSARNYPRLGR